MDEEQVVRTKAAIISETVAQDMAEFYAALADSTRLRLLHCLSIAELCVCDLSAAAGISQSTVSHHLRMLRNLRLVKHRRSGRLVYYSLDDQHIKDLLEQGLEHLLEGGRR